MHYLFSLLMWLVFACMVQAQVGLSRNDLAVGVSLGVTMTSVNFEPTIRQKQFVAPTAGLTLRYTSERYFTMYCAVQAELNYATLGWKEDIVNAAGEALPDRYERRIHYVQLPLLASLGWGKEYRGVMFRFLLGPQLGVYISDSDMRRNFTLDEQGEPIRLNNVYQQYDLPIKHKIDYGLIGGLALEWNNKAGHFWLEGRYYYGLADLFSNAKSDVFSRSANQTITLKLGYLLPLKGQHPRLQKF